MTIHYGCVRILVLELELVGGAKFYSIGLVVLTVLLSELELLELSRPKCKFPEAAELKWRVQMLRSLWTFLLVLMNTLWRPSAWQTPEETKFGTDYSNFLASSSKKPNAKPC